MRNQKEITIPTWKKMRKRDLIWKHVYVTNHVNLCLYSQISNVDI